MTKLNAGKRRLRAAIYVRVSTVRQAERELSIPDQLRQLTEYCQVHSIDLVDKYIEQGASGRDESRPEFQRMLVRACSDESPYDLILVHSFSRFARDGLVLHGRNRELMAHGVRLQAITQSTDDSPEGHMMMSIIGAFDEYSSAQNSKHTHRAMCQCARDGYWPGSHAPDGFRKVPAAKVGDKTRYTLEPDPVRAPVIERIFEMSLTGEGAGPMGVKAITKRLNELGLRTRKGSRWGIGTVHGILTSTTYIGEHYFNRSSPKLKGDRPREEWISFPVDPLVSREVFDAVNRNLKEKAPRKTAPRLPGSPMLLTGIIRCGGCGGAMTQMTGKSGRYTYYACSNRRRTGIDVCDGRNVRQETVEAAVCEALAERVLSPEHVEELIEACVEQARANSDVEIKMRAAQKAVLDAEAGLKRLYDGIASGVLDPTEPLLKEQVDGLKLRKVDAAATLNRYKVLKEAAFTPPSAEKVARFSQELRKRITEGDIPLRKAYIRALVERITMHNDHIEISGRKDLLASAAAKGSITPSGGVPSFVPEWCPEQESNLRPNA